MTSSSDAISRPLEPHAVPIVTRKRQKLSLAPQPDEIMYLVRRGIVIARAALPQERHQVLGIFYPGDIIRASAVPPLDGVCVSTVSETGEVWRLRWPVVKNMTDGCQDLARMVSDRLTEQTARTTLHSAILSGLTGDERVAALMFEFALRTGTKTPAGIIFEMPLSRMDIAEHLALNADTVSRIVSRMRANGVVVPAGRNALRTTFEALSQACPLAPAIARMHKAENLLPA